MTGHEHSRERITHPPESGVNHEMCHHHSEIGTEEQSQQRREGVKMRRAAEERSPHQSDVAEDGHAEKARCPPAIPGRYQSDQEQVLESVGDGHTAVSYTHLTL